jgi:hypothetical protein
MPTAVENSIGTRAIDQWYQKYLGRGADAGLEEPGKEMAGAIKAFNFTNPPDWDVFGQEVKGEIGLLLPAVQHETVDLLGVAPPIPDDHGLV